MDRKRVSLPIEQGRTLKAWFWVGLKDGTVIDLPDAGFTRALLQVRDKHLSDGGDVLLSLTTENGGVVLGPMDDGTGKIWAGYIYAPPAITKNLPPWGEAVYDLVAIHTDGGAETVARGDAYLILAVSDVQP